MWVGVYRSSNKCLPLAMISGTKACLKVLAAKLGWSSKGCAERVCSTDLSRRWWANERGIIVCVSRFRCGDVCRKVFAASGKLTERGCSSQLCEYLVWWQTDSIWSGNLRGNRDCAELVENLSNRYLTKLSLSLLELPCCVYGMCYLGL